MSAKQVSAAYDECIQLCRDYSARNGSVYIKDVEGAIEALKIRAAEAEFDYGMPLDTQCNTCGHTYGEHYGRYCEHGSSESVFSPAGHPGDCAFLVSRINEYLNLGGLWNPESMEHDKVRTLLMDCRAVLTKQAT